MSTKMRAVSHDVEVASIVKVRMRGTLLDIAKRVVVWNSVAQFWVISIFFLKSGCHVLYVIRLM